MKILLAFFLLLLSGFLFAQEKERPFEIGFYSGYASADLKWSIAGNSDGQSPNVLSEVKWNDVAGLSIGTSLKVKITKNWFVAGRFSKCFVNNGTVTDADYAQDNRQNRTYYAKLSGNEGSLNDFFAYAGYYFLNQTRVKLAALAGYNLSKEHLFLLNPRSVATGEKSLRSTYQTSWKAPSLGACVNYQLVNKLNVDARFVYGQLKYNASADWNMIDAFAHPVSFTHYAKGFSTETLLALSYQLNRRLALTLAGTCINAQTGTGIDRLYLESGGTQTTQFNGTNKTLKNIWAGLTFRL